MPHEEMPAPFDAHERGIGYPGRRSSGGSIGGEGIEPLPAENPIT
jgi:hypothetical protein